MLTQKAEGHFDRNALPGNFLIGYWRGFAHLACLKGQEQIAATIHLNRHIVTQADLVNDRGPARSDVVGAFGHCAGAVFVNQGDSIPEVGIGHHIQRRCCLKFTCCGG